VWRDDGPSHGRRRCYCCCYYYYYYYYYYLSASAVVIHYEEELYQVYAPLPFTLYYYPLSQKSKTLYSCP